MAYNQAQGLFPAAPGPSSHGLLGLPLCFLAQKPPGPACCHFPSRTNRPTGLPLLSKSHGPFSCTQRPSPYASTHNCFPHLQGTHPTAPGAATRNRRPFQHTTIPYVPKAAAICQLQLLRSHLLVDSNNTRLGNCSPAGSVLSFTQLPPSTTDNSTIVHLRQ